ncbi:VOC family protein [Nitratireductor basaltis]|uniref:Glyoxalase-like domain-containing protein n=1 Tax=Nitratireductor basaltis TaxID=472175 RepID=A0A084UAI8_9HYPH|nr:VOC family protein [Nitratireductor basaltis]KFB09974.1 hypothetical protein EL18_01001 [Nitratireductor basaltis]
MSDRAPTTSTVAIDHCVLPVASLAVARERYEALGFTVAPDALHPFGTGNACIFFADGTYLEPLAVCDRTAYRDALSDQNSFILRDKSFRQTQGNEGFSALALKTDDARADHERFLLSGNSAGAPVEFARPLKGPDGSTGEARFRLAFSAPAGTGGFCFTCQRLHRSAMGGGTSSRHGNGVSGLLSVSVKVGDLETAQIYFSKLACVPAIGTETGAVVRFRNCAVHLEQDPAMPDSDEIRFDAVTFSCADPGKLRQILTRSNIVWQERNGAIHIPTAPGQGATFIFKENDHEA